MLRFMEINNIKIKDRKAHPNLGYYYYKYGCIHWYYLRDLGKGRENFIEADECFKKQYAGRKWDLGDFPEMYLNNLIHMGDNLRLKKELNYYFHQIIKYNRKIGYGIEAYYPKFYDMALYLIAAGDYRAAIKSYDSYLKELKKCSNAKKEMWEIRKFLHAYISSDVSGLKKRLRSFKGALYPPLGASFCVGIDEVIYRRALEKIDAAKGGRQLGRR